MSRVLTLAGLAAALSGGLALALPGPQEREGATAGLLESEVCATCHSRGERATAMRDASGADVSPHGLWQGTMMANSARDPLWRAVVSAEIAATPARREEIERTCLRCHAPMAERVGLEDHDTGSLLHVLDCDGRLGDLARDGVSCTICHGMTPEGLGTEASFGAGFVLDRERRLFGPHEAPFAMPMRMHTGFTPTYATHVTGSALCGSCHTLLTATLDPEGNEVGEEPFLEQAPYLEWRNSAFRDEGDDPGPLAASCQDCHVPTHDGEGRELVARIARNPGGRDFPPVKPRRPFGRHVFVGGNTLVPAILRDHAEELRVTASREALERTLEATREQLARRSARVSVDDVRADGGTLAFRVRVENLTGHKLPTAHPTRRAWLRVVVRDAHGAVLFASGRADGRGRIVDGRGVPLASEAAGGPVEPHRDVVRSADEVATFQGVLADAEGRPTHSLLRAAGWVVDDRLLPRGWDPEHAEAARTAPVGVGADPDFAGGGDGVAYELTLAGRPARLEATLLYQPLGARWAAELFTFDTPEIATFRRFYEAADAGPEELARVELELP